MRLHRHQIHAGLAIAASLALAVGPAAGAEPPLGHGPYAWAPVSAEPRQARDPRLENAGFRMRLHAAIDHGLAGKGLTRMDSPDNARVLVAYHVSLRFKTDARPTRDAMPALPCTAPGCISGWGVYGPPQAQLRSMHYEEGKLILDLSDRKTGQLLWQGVSHRRITNKEASEAALREVVEDALKSLPN